MKKIIALLLAAALLLGMLPMAMAAEAVAMPLTAAETADGVAAYLTAQIQKSGRYSDWTMMQLARGGNLPEELRADYLRAMAVKVRAVKGVLDARYNTTYARTALALTACGVNAADFAGYNLIAPLGNYEKTARQGTNGLVYALLALDCGGYELPEGATTTREKLVAGLLAAELKDGGWTYSGTAADTDLSAMAIQALAPYYAQNADVRAAVDRALTILSKRQQADGGYVSWGSACSESPAQVLLALCCLGIDPAKDARFVKENGAWLGSAIYQFRAPGEALAFGHADQTANQLATEQIGYAMVGYQRLLEGKTSLYDMSDVDFAAPRYAYVGVYDYTAVAGKLDHASKTGVVLKDYAVKLTEGMTATELVQAAFAANGITAPGLEAGFVSEINGLGSAGGYSGWLLNYNNDDFSNLGLASITPKEGDVLQFHYSFNLDTTTDDVGNGWYGLPVFTRLTIGEQSVKMTRKTVTDENYNMTSSYYVDGVAAEGSGTADDPFRLSFDLGYAADPKAQKVSYETSLDAHYAIVTGLDSADFSKPVDCTILTLGGKSVAHFRITVKAHACRRYTDVDGHWGRDEICGVTERGLMNGMADTRFEPETTLTRAMLVTILYREAGTPDVGKPTFADVAADAWYASAVEWARENGITDGMGGNRFAPEMPITREQLATFLWRFAGKKNGAALPDKFVDRTSVSVWAAEAMAWAVAQGIVNGTDGNRLDPQGLATRAQCAAMLDRFLNTK